MIRRVVVSTTVAVLCMTIAGPAVADGLQSQWKNRMPQFSGSADPSAMTRYKPLDTSEAIVPLNDEITIGMMVRRKARLTSRKMKLEKEKNANTQEGVAPYAVPGTGNHVDREELVRRGRKYQQLQCNKLHTHERARCYFEAQIKKMERFQTSVMEVGSN
jgi:hypothetical protein